MRSSRHYRTRSSQLQKYFEAVSKMAADPEAPPAYQELGKVLQSILAGVTDPDLSQLPDEFAEIVREALAHPSA